MGQGRGQGVSRRAVLARIGAVGGSAAIIHAATGLGVLAAPGPARFAMAPHPSADRGGKKPHVVILGAGVGGLCAAYELERAGYRCTVLEASHRIGGRNFTVRRGAVIDELGNRQVCDFDDAPHLYFNAGPARIPGMHHRFLGYCRELGVKLEPFINVNYNAWVQDAALNGGRPVRHRQVMADARGFMAELAAKTLRPESLDAPMTPEDMAKLHEALGLYGDLTEDLAYAGSDRAGHVVEAMLKPGEANGALSFRELILARATGFAMNFAQFEFQAPSLMQPVGGMDRFVTALADRLTSDIRLHAMATDITNTAEGVAVAYARKGETGVVEADYCLNAIPGHLMRGLRTNFEPAYRALVDKIEPYTLSKLGLQFSRRFWEEDGIYGGISWTDHMMLQMWYPSHGAHEAKGVMLGGYIFFGEDNDRFARMSHAERMAAGLEAGEAIHPGRYKALAETGVSVAWSRMNHMLGCGHGAPDAPEVLAALQRPHGRHYLIGDQTTLHPGWQEGAIVSAQNALTDIAAREAARHG